MIDTDLDQMTREELIAHVKKLRKGIREHRDSSRHQLCWHHPSLWGLLPKGQILYLSCLNGQSSYEAA